MKVDVNKTSSELSSINAMTTECHCFQKGKTSLSAFSGFNKFNLAEITAAAELNKRLDGTLVPGTEKTV